MSFVGFGSNVYVNEPSSSGRVVLITSAGDVELEFWIKEAPMACRNFIQLCLDGYYNNTVFHRILKGVLIQGGDPTGEGTGGKSSYGHPFVNEPHSRLRFVRRGLIATASEQSSEESKGKSGLECNGSQFFITLGQCEWLNNHHTIFGRIVGDGIFTVISLADTTVDSHDRPLVLPKIIRTEVIENPFPDIICRIKEQKEQTNPIFKQPRRTNTKCLSFNEDEDEVKVKKIKSSHSVFNPEENQESELKTHNDSQNNSIPDKNKKIYDHTDRDRDSFIRDKKKSDHKRTFPTEEEEIRVRRKNLKNDVQKLYKEVYKRDKINSEKVKEKKKNPFDALQKKYEHCKWKNKSKQERQKHALDSLELFQKRLKTSIFTLQNDDDDSK